MSFQAVRLTTEATPGTFNGSGTATTIRLSKSNAFPGRVTPIINNIRDAAGTNRVVHSRSSQFGTKGKFGTLLYFGAQSKVLLPWAINITGSPLGMSSVTMDHMIQIEDGSGTMVYERYLGCYCDQMHLAAANGGEGVLVYMDFDFTFMGIAAITGTDFPTPALTGYPTGAEAVFQQMDGGFTLGSTVASFKSFDMTIKNILRPQYDAKAYPQRIRWCGRDVDFKTKVLYSATTPRSDFQALTAKTCSMVLTDGTNSITLDFKTSGLYTSVEDDLPLDDEASQTLSVMPRLDTSAATDVSLTIAP